MSSRVIFFLFFALISVFTRASSADVTCGPDDTYLANPVDCSSFYQCANGITYLLHCPPTQDVPLVFDPNLKVCVWQSDYDCTESIITTTSSESTTQSTITTEEPTVTTVEPSVTTVEPTPTTAEPIESTVEPSETTAETSETTTEFPENFCHESSHPTTCQGSPHNCSFCYDACFKEGSPRCDTYDNLLQAGCRSFAVNRTEYNSVVVANPSCSTWIPLEAGRKRNISVTFSAAKYPLDFYYLMDFSGSMGDDRVNLIKLIADLPETLAEFSNDFRIGFGTFVDKPIAPFGTSVDYSFHNDFPITSEFDGLAQKISDLPIKRGKDEPGSHGDALAQVIECTDQIGWRDNTRRVVLLATDIEFHIVGEGKSANITSPYVEGCYLDASGAYTEELTMDYPSVQQLGQAYSKKQATATVIFATSDVPIEILWFYENMAILRFKSAYVAPLKSDSSNVLELIRNEFAKIESRMEIEKTDTNDSVSFRFFSNCMNSDHEGERTVCDHLPYAGDVTFTVEINLAKCPKDKDETGMMFELNPVGLPSFIEVELSLLLGLLNKIS